MSKESLVNVLTEIEKIYSNFGETFKARAYKRASEILILEKNKTFTIDDLKKLKIGNSIFKNLEEFINKGNVDFIEVSKKNPIHLFTKIYGVGPKKAAMLANKYKDIQELRDATKSDSTVLNDKQKIGLKYYEEILEKIPRSEIDKYKIRVEEILKRFTTNIRAEIVGSYRRGAEQSGDIDIIITSDKQGDFDMFIDKFADGDNVVEFLSRGNTKCLIIGKLKNNKPRRIDFMFTNEIQYPFAILYFTGSKDFNVKMRQHALSKGMSLNEHGIKYLDNTKTMDFTPKTENDIFEFLKIEYTHPTQRGSNELKLITTIRPIRTFVKGKLKINKTKDKKTKIEKIVKELKDASDAYYNGIPIMSDFEFDTLQETLRNIDPENPELSKIGAPIKDGKKVKLPYFMPSMDKVKPDSFEKWIQKYSTDFVFSAKLDGVSAMYIRNENGDDKLYTRGNGLIGSDISNLLDFIPSFKAIKKSNNKFVARGELIISNENFIKRFNQSKANARNTVSGLISQKQPNKEDMKFIDFIVYEIINPELTPKNQLEYAQEVGLKPVNYISSDYVNTKQISELLVDWRKNLEYAIDGIIVTHNQTYQREDANPKHSVAFKMVLEDQKSISKVIDVTWNISKHGFAKPVIIIEPVSIGGVIVRKISGQNARFMVNHKIAKDAIIEVVRRGDVIPYVERVVNISTNEPLPNFDFKWNDTKVDIVVDNKYLIEEKAVYSFFTGFELDGVGLGIISKIRHFGYKSTFDILNISKEELLKIDGIADKKATKIYNGIQEVKSKMRNDMSKTMSLSGVFGRGLGKRKLVEVTKTYPKIFQMHPTVDDIKKVTGFSNKLANQFINGFDKFKEFSDKVGISKDFLNSHTQYTDVSNHKPLKMKSFQFTGFRDKKMESSILILGGEIKTSFSNNLDGLIIKDSDVSNSKTIKAIENEVPIFTIKDMQNMIKELT